MSDKKFDKKIRETLENHEPNAKADWGKMKERIAALSALGAIGVDAASTRVISQLSIGAAVIIGSASLFVFQNYLTSETILEDEALEMVVHEDALQTLDGKGEDYEVVYNKATGRLEPVEDNISSVVSISKDIQVENSINKDAVVLKADVIEGLKRDHTEAELLDVFNPASKEIPFEISTKEACVGIKVDFVLRDLDKNMNFLWNFGDGSFSSEPEPSHIYEEEGIFDVTLSVRSHGTGAIKTRTIERLIEIHKLPEALFSWTMPSNVVNSNVQVELNNETKDANSTTWIVDGSVSDDNTPDFKVPGKYELNLVASNKFGCQDHAHKVIEFGNRNTLNAPAIFSPNGDGRYDTFMPFGLQGLSEKWELVISDEHGDIVFTTTDFNSPWLGEFQEGGLVPDGQVFNWTVVCHSHSGKQRLYTDVIKAER